LSLRLFLTRLLTKDTFKWVKVDYILGENMIKKLFVVASIILLLPNIAFISNSIQMADMETVYVDDDNVEGPWDGSLQYPYKDIQEGIKAVAINGIVHVFNGIYIENIIIDKPVTLIGQDKDSTIIDGGSSGGVITIQDVHDVVIQNFTIRNGISEGEEKGWGISMGSVGSIVISHTVIYDNDVGIICDDGSINCMILSNQIMNNQIGIDIYSSSSNLIYANTIKNNDINILLYQSKNNRISNNNIYDGGKNVEFFDSYDQLLNNYWGTSSSFYIIFGKIRIPSLGITIPWIKCDIHPLKTIDSFDCHPLARMRTSMGTMMLELYSQFLPITANNFIRLAEIGFFEQLVFHRVIDDFVIQGGGYYANGTNKQSPFGTIELEIHPDITHVDGAISMARTNDPHSATSQFFICDGAQHRLDGNYSAFGNVIVGLTVLRDIASVETKTKYGFMKDWPVDDVFIEDVSIFYP